MRFARVATVAGLAVALAIGGTVYEANAASTTPTVKVCVEHGPAGGTTAAGNIMEYDWNNSACPAGTYLLELSGVPTPTPTATTPTPTPTATTPTPTPTPTSSSQMAAPSGFTTKIFEDQFTGTTLDTTKWVTYLGAEGAVWNNNGSLPLPYSGHNIPGSGNNDEMYAPSQVTVNNGVTLTAQKNTNQYASSYPWISGIITTEGKFSLPVTSSWYVQVKAKMPDTSAGMWPAIWFLRGPSGSPDNEFDGYEGGFTGVSGNINDVMHSDFFADQGQSQNAYNVGTDLSAGYNVYGVQFVPNTSITVFLNGKQVYQVLASQGFTIAAEPYQIMLQLQVAATGASGWHTADSANTPTSSMSIAEVQAYTP